MNVFLSGGGLDSAAFLALQASNMDQVYVCDYGQTMYQQEYVATQALLSMLGQPDPVPLNLRITKLSEVNPTGLLFGTGSDPFVRGRNLQLAQSVALHALEQIGTDEPLAIHFGFCLENMMFSDADPDFIRHLDQCVQRSFGLTNAGQHLVSVVAPYHEVPKAEYLHLAATRLNELTISPKSFFDQTFTCWHPQGSSECGGCAHCLKKARFLGAMGYGK